MKMTEEQKENWELVRQDLLADLAEKRHNHPKPTHIDVEVVVSVTLRVQVPLEPGDLIRGEPVFDSEDQARHAMGHARTIAENSISPTTFPTDSHVSEVTSIVRNAYEVFIWAKHECENEDTPCDGCEDTE